jgi:hypothetical protein
MHCHDITRQCMQRMKQYLWVHALNPAQKQTSRACCHYIFIIQMVKSVNRVDCKYFISAQEKVCWGDCLPFLSNGMEVKGHSKLLSHTSKPVTGFLNSFSGSESRFWPINAWNQKRGQRSQIPQLWPHQNLEGSKVLTACHFLHINLSLLDPLWT